MASSTAASNEDPTPSPEEIILYDKDPRTKIATITFNRPESLNAPTIAARHYYARLLHRANIDDEVRVLVIRGMGDDFGSGADLPELMKLRSSDDGSTALRRETGFEDDPDISMPRAGTYRASSTLSHWYANPVSGCRTLQDFKKISIVEAKGYCYGWHFYQAGDADLVIASEDALFGHPAFRYAGWGPRMWTWAMMMGLRKFQEMVFTGRPFTAKQMYDCNFVNSVVPRADLEDEVAKYASACATTRPTDYVFAQKAFFEIMKQFRGEYMGSIMTAWLESMGNAMRPDEGDLTLSEDVIQHGIALAVKDNDAQFPSDWRLSKESRRQP